MVSLQATVIYVDERLVAVAKPPGLSLATPRRAPSAALERLLAALPEAEVIGLGLSSENTFLVHRLDVTTSGLVLLARSEDAHRELSLSLANRLADKRYLALVWGHPRPAAGRWEEPLGPDRADRRRMVVALDGRPAASEYRTLGRAPHVSLLELRPKSGRTHQLRVHAAHQGHPIVGDDLYGGPRHRGVRMPAQREVLEPGRPLLHSWRLGLPEGRGRDELRLEAPLQEDFASALEALGHGLTAAVEAAGWDD